MAPHENLPYKIIGVCRCTAVGTINKAVRTTVVTLLSSCCERVQSCNEQPLSTAKAEALGHLRHSTTQDKFSFSTSKWDVVVLSVSSWLQM